VGLTTLLHLEEIRNEWSYTATPPICLHGVGSDGNFTFFLSKEMNEKNEERRGHVL